MKYETNPITRWVNHIKKCGLCNKKTQEIELFKVSLGKTIKYIPICRDCFYKLPTLRKAFSIRWCDICGRKFFRRYPYQRIPTVKLLPIKRGSEVRYMVVHRMCFEKILDMPPEILAERRDG